MIAYSVLLYEYAVCMCAAELVCDSPQGVRVCNWNNVVVLSSTISLQLQRERIGKRVPFSRRCSQAGNTLSPDIRLTLVLEYRFRNGSECTPVDMCHFQSFGDVISIDDGIGIHDTVVFSVMLDDIKTGSNTLRIL
jgi:hypothetical protein